MPLYRAFIHKVQIILKSWLTYLDRVYVLRDVKLANVQYARIHDHLESYLANRISVTYLSPPSRTKCTWILK